MLTMTSPIALSGQAPPDQQPQTVAELSFLLQQAILRDGIISPDEQRAVGGLLESLRQFAAQQQAQQMAGQQQPMSGETSDAFSTEGTEPSGGEYDDGTEPMPYQ